MPVIMPAFSITNVSNTKSRGHQRINGHIVVDCRSQSMSTQNNDLELEQKLVCLNLVWVGIRDYIPWRERCSASLTG